MINVLLIYRILSIFVTKKNKMIKEKVILALNDRFKESSFILTGSYKTGQFKPKSDIDIVVLSPHIAISYNEKYYLDAIDKNIDCLVIPQNRVIEELEKSYMSKSGALIRMISKGEVLYDKHNSLNSIFDICNFFYHKGKEYNNIDEHEIKNKCIKISNAIDDLVDCENNLEKQILLSRIFDELSHLYCIANNRWESNGKARLTELKIIAPKFINDFNYITEELFIQSKVSDNIITTLNNHLNLFHNFKNQYSTRKAYIDNKKIYIEIIDVSLNDYKSIVSLISYYFNKKFKLYIKAFSFEYKDTLAKSFLNIELFEDLYGLKSIEIFNSIKADILTPLNCYIAQNISFKGVLGGEYLNDQFENFKNRFSYELTQYLKTKSIDYKKEDIFGTGFLLSLYIYKLINTSLRKKFSKYIYEDILPSTFDIRALKSYEELIFEKEKIINHFKLRYQENKSNFNRFIKDFINENVDAEEILSSSLLLDKIKIDLKKIILDITGREKDFFSYEYHDLNVDIEDAKLLIAYRKLLETMYNILGIPSVDRGFIFYILNNYRHV